jgi:hypothetical protein
MMLAPSLLSMDLQFSSMLLRTGLCGRPSLNLQLLASPTTQLSICSHYIIQGRPPTLNLS